MKAVTCELCGSNDIIKIEGYFVCQHCGTKYSIDEAKHLVVDGTVKVSGVVTIDNSDNLKNLYQLAKRAVEIGDGEGAIKYYNRILEVDPMSWEAILYIGYFGVLTSKFGDICDATTSLTNAIYLSCEIVKNNIEDEEKQKQACIEISFRALFLADHLFECATGISNTSDEYNNIRVLKTRSVQIAHSLGHWFNYFFRNLNGIHDIVFESYKSALNYSIGLGVGTDSSIISEMVDYLKIYNPTYSYPEPHKGEGCYIATAIYGTYNCPQVLTLRHYRDETLARTRTGRMFIKAYYSISPQLVKKYGTSKIFNSGFRYMLDKIVCKLNQENK